MKLATNTLSVLKNYCSINSSILIHPGSTLKTVSSNKTVISKAEVEDKFETKFAIYRLDRFLSTLSLFNDPELTFHEKHVEISDGKRKTKYLYAEESTIIKPPEKEIKLPNVDVEFSMTNENFKDVERAASVLGYTEIVVAGDGTNVSLQTQNVKDEKTSDVHSIVIGETDKTFKAVFKTENMKLLPGDYDVSISSRGISKFVGKGFPYEIEYYVAVETSSTF